MVLPAAAGAFCSEHLMAFADLPRQCSVIQLSFIVSLDVFVRGLNIPVQCCAGFRSNPINNVYGKFSL